MITLKTLPDATAQEVFDQVTTHLLTQMEKAAQEESGGECVYLAEDGLKCAAGCLMADDEYEPRWDTETLTWDALVNLGYAPRNHDMLILSLQKVHDMNQPDLWFEKLLKLSIEFDLSFNPPS